MQQQTIRSVLAAVVALAAIASFTVVYSGTSPQAAGTDAQLAVRCEAGQRALVQQAEASDQTVVACVTDAGAPAQTGYGAPHVATVRSPLRQAPQAVYAPAATQVYAPAAAPVAAPVLRPVAPGTATRETGSSWQKRVLIIGGAAGAGAGVGAMSGGKKGALIGAAIGGGGAALFDVLRNKDQ